MSARRIPNWLGYTAIIVAVILVQIIGGLATASSVSTWYQTLVKPPHNPPNWVFAPVWTILYILMTVAACRVWRVTRPSWRSLGWFWYQLQLNLLWSVAFFGLRSPQLALIVMLPLIYAIYRNYRAFRMHDAVAANLLLPYLAWVCFALTLNAGIVILNP